MKIAFVYFEEESLGIEYLSAMLKEGGHEVELFFDPLLFGDSIIQTKFFKRLFSFKSEIIAKIKKFNPEVVCFSVISDYYPYAYELAKSIKENLGAPIIFGGWHPTSAPEEVIKNDFVDFIIIGEGEYALLDLISDLENNKDGSRIKNVWSKKNGKVIINPLRNLIESLDSLPFPDKKIFYDKNPYLKTVYTIVTSRGCPFRCTYCNNNYMHKLYSKSKYHRRRSVDDVITELKLAKKKYNPRLVMFHDEIFISDINWLKQFAGKYKKEIGLPYFCWVHPSFINRESVKLLKESGCTHAQMGVQTISEETRRKVLHRYYSNECIEHAIRLLKEENIFLTADNIMGLPNQDEKELLELVNFYSKNKVNLINIYWLRYYPKTEIIDIALKHKTINDSDLNHVYEASSDKSFLFKGHTYDKDIAKIRTLMFISQSIPQRITGWLIKNKRYRFIPAYNSSFLNPFLINHMMTKFFNRFFKGITDYQAEIRLKKYIHFMKSKISINANNLYKKTFKSSLANEQRAQ